MAIFKSASSICLRTYSFAAGVISLIFSLVVFIGYLFSSSFINAPGNKDLLNLHCMFMTVASFLQIFANIFLIVGCLKQCHQYVRAWLILSGISWLLIVAGCSLLAHMEDIWAKISAPYITTIAVTACFYLVNCDVVYCYYLERHRIAYGSLL